VGVGLTILVFAGKAGLAAGSMNLGAARILAVALGFGVIAFLMGIVLKIVNPLDYFSFFQNFMTWGVLVHLFLSLGLMAWGFVIMKAAKTGSRLNKTSRIFFLLPCPVCLSAMLLSCSVASALSGIDSVKAGIGIGALFALIIPAVWLTSRAQMQRQAGAGQGPLLPGYLMTLVGLYFAVSIIVVPIYSKAKAVVSATGGMAVGARLSFQEAAFLLIIVAGIFGLGFLKHRKPFSMKKTNEE
jgi:predicted transporter